MAYISPNRERRVLKAGHSSIAVTLPKPWAEAMNLPAGRCGRLRPERRRHPVPQTRSSPGAPTNGVPYLVQARSFETPGVLTRLVVGAYRVGHDAIEIRTELPLGPERIEELQAAARTLLGVSIVAQEPTRILLQNFIDPSKYSCRSWSSG